ncbi:MAG: hypothetical protein LC102_09155 [Ignavibacteriales bacterium]|nr:MAG: hypothetical protein F9K26_05445 [Ignavibacteriaceae bacterium]MBW7872862.1 hypothetical protein [Ignavibacteria bacterium]MCZ2143582.1 hypothetical protein [Ignavibacteriales bacterium]MBV6444457.1 hypothetical protein [Ignavibacteriaceae bacterium]MBZ0197262.1 hypothetical protein [Ignavibacteriaceae bacterium]
MDEENILVEAQRKVSETAQKLHSYAVNGMFISALALKRIFDEELYLELGCKTQSEYINKYLPFNRMQAYRYVRVADVFVQTMNIDLNSTFRVFLLTGKPEDVTPVLQSTREYITELWDIGIKKLYLLVSKIPAERMKMLTDTGVLILEKGSMTIQEMRYMSYDALATRILEGETKIALPDDEEPGFDLMRESRSILTQARFMRAKFEQLLACPNLREEPEKIHAIRAKLSELEKELKSLTWRIEHDPEYNR